MFPIIKPVCKWVPYTQKNTYFSRGQMGHTKFSFPRIM